MPKKIVSIVEDIGWRQTSQTKKSEKIVFFGMEVEKKIRIRKKWKKMKNKENIKVPRKAGKAFWFSLIASTDKLPLCLEKTSNVNLNSVINSNPLKIQDIFED